MKRVLQMLPFFLVALPLWAGGGDGGNTEKPKYNNETYVPTADEVIHKMFEMGKVSKDDLIFDLGCGDGRILYMAAKKYDVGTLVEIRHGDALRPKDLSDATVVVLYMFPEFMNLWLPIAKEKLRPGTRILSHDYTWDAKYNWPPDQSVTVKSSVREHRVHMWTVRGK